jgi:hypothetical protein
MLLDVVAEPPVRLVSQPLRRYAVRRLDQGQLDEKQGKTMCEGCLA